MCTQKHEPTKKRAGFNNDKGTLVSFPSNVKIFAAGCSADDQDRINVCSKRFVKRWVLFLIHSGGRDIVGYE